MALCRGRQGQEVQEKHHGGRRKVLDYEVREVVMAVSWRTGSIRVTGAGVGDSGKVASELDLDPVVPGDHDRPRSMGYW